MNPEFREGDKVKVVAGDCVIGAVGDVVQVEGGIMLVEFDDGSVMPVLELEIEKV